MGVSPMTIHNWIHKYARNYREVNATDAVTERERPCKFPLVNEDVYKYINTRVEANGISGIGISWTFIQGTIDLIQLQCLCDPHCLYENRESSKEEQ
jgi:hypothetical protein